MGSMDGQDIPSISWHSFIDLSGEIGLGEYWGTQGAILLLLVWLAFHFLVLPASPFPPDSFYPLLANKGVILPMFESTTHYQLHCIWNLAVMGCLIAGFYSTTSLFLTLCLGSGSLETASEIGILVHVIYWGRVLRDLKEAEQITRWLSWNMISDRPCFALILRERAFVLHLSVNGWDLPMGKKQFTFQARWLSSSKGNSPKKEGSCEPPAATTHRSWRNLCTSLVKGIWARYPVPTILCDTQWNGNR